MTERRILTRDEWALVEPKVTGEFGNALPAREEQASFLAQLSAGGSLDAFVHVETLFHFNCVWVAPHLRGTGLGLSLLADAARRLPAGFSGLCLTKKPADGIARLLGARSLGSLRVYRRDA